MYYNEKFIDGDWYFKRTPKGEWRLFTRAMLLGKLEEGQILIDILSDKHKKW